MTHCWNWNGSKLKSGYGTLYDPEAYKRDGKHHKLAHRYYYEKLIGLIPDGMQVCHHCDNPSCVNPEHLFLGTQKDNMNDCIAKGRHMPFVGKGECNPTAKLTWDDVGEIRTQYHYSGISQKALGMIYRVARTDIGNIVRNESWNEQEE